MVAEQPSSYALTIRLERALSNSAGPLAVDTCAVVIWVNGPFGVGKTSVAENLAARWPSATVIVADLSDMADHELAGYWKDVRTAARALSRCTSPAI